MASRAVVPLAAARTCVSDVEPADVPSIAAGILMKDLDIKEAFFCKCMSPEHLLAAYVTTFPKHGDKDFYFSMQLNHYRPWYRRIWPAIKYIFGNTSIGWAETLISPDDLNRLKQLIQQYEDA